jgi:endoglucanase
MPKECKQPRYVVQKTTAVALDFAATMAKASRIYGEFAQYKDFAEEARRQAKLAFDWAVAHPAVYYRQNEMNAKYEPKVNTGAYDDMNVNDEFLWAATEIIITELVNRNMSVEQYYNVAMEKMNDVRYGLPTWGNVASLAIYSFIGAMEKYGSQMGEPQVYGFIKEQVLQYADAALATIPTSCYNNPGGNSPRDFFWGCNSESFAGQGIMMLYAYRLTGDKKYLTAALENADYLLGRNATGYCYVTGFGNYSPKNPHHRLSAADNVADPLPGFLVGGSNPGQQDKKDVQEPYKSSQPDESYLDNMGSYASNEIAINWNASLAALICWIEAEE